MRWQCQFHNSKGIRCAKEASHRVHFSKDHPFDHMDVCDEHLEIHQGYVWKEEFKRENLCP